MTSAVIHNRDCVAGMAFDPRPDEIEVTDIAHALSLLCRYGGHVDR